MRKCATPARRDSQASDRIVAEIRTRLLCGIKGVGQPISEEGRRADLGDHNMGRPGVQGHNVTFYRDLERLGVVAMQQQMTDCINGFEGVLLGDPGLTLGQVNSTCYDWIPCLL
jgi:hypothetical protein